MPASQTKVADGFTSEAMAVTVQSTSPAILIEKSPQYRGKMRAGEDDNLLSSLRASECLDSPINGSRN